MEENLKNDESISQVVDADSIKVDNGIPTVSNNEKKPKKKKRLTLAQKEALTGWAFVTPVMIGFLVFTVFSMLYSLYISFTDWNMLKDPKWVGFSNYKNLFTKDLFFWDYLGNTIYYVIVLVPVVLVVSLTFAILLNKKVKGMTTFYRACLFLPCVVSTVAVSLVWTWIFNSSEGMLNSILIRLGVSNPPGWLSTPGMAKNSIIIMRVWQMSGYYMVMFLTGLQTIPEVLYEAAEVDGASKLQKLWYITIPLLRPTTFAITIFLVLEAFNIFEIVLIMTQGRMDTSSLMYYIYTLAFENYRMGYASALAWILFIIILGFTILRFTTKKEEKM